MSDSQKNYEYMKNMQGSEIGVSEWVLIDQQKIDDLAKQYQDAEGEIPEAIAEYVSKIKPLIWIVTDNGIGTLKSRDLFIEEVYGKFDEHFTKYEN